MKPVRLEIKALEKVWGTPHTEPWYKNADTKQIGEVWFAASEQVPLLVKFLFTSDNLSVQVHPADEYARENHNSRGKTEMWHILRAAPGAKIAIGLREVLSPERLRETSLSGEIMELLNWIPVNRGDTFFVPAGTIHALGGDLAVCEVQQYSDVTYRLYDYGRPRELHLDHSMKVCCLEPYDGKAIPMTVGLGRELLVECPYFHTERWRVAGTLAAPARNANSLYIVIDGEGTIGGEPFQTGDGFEASAGNPSFEIQSSNAIFLVTSEKP